MEGNASQEYADPVRFFASTYPTKGIRELLRQVLARLGGTNNTSVFWLNTSFGGGKTHALIALLHAAQSPPPEAVSEFVGKVPLSPDAKIAVFDGQNADISNGHSLGDGIMAHTPWGEIAYRLAGKMGYKRVDDSGTGSAPGADTLKDLLGDGPVLILLDELAVYLRKAERHEGAGKQFTAFLTGLIKAVNETRNAALVYTLAAGQEGDAYSDENRRIMDELKSVSSRQATLLNPTEEGETIQILRRRLFERRDESRVDEVVSAYRKAWELNRDKLPDAVDSPRIVDEFRAGYPLHPDILNTLISKTSTLEDFQRVRGMLRLLGYVVHDLWVRRDKIKPAAIHVHHFDMGNEAIRLEITAKLKQDAFASAIDMDIACDDANKTSQAQRLDKKFYPNLPPFTTYVARTIFMHTLAFNTQLKGIDDRSLRYSILSPGMEIIYIDEALAKFRNESQYLDDNPDRPTQFRAVPNLNQAIQRAEQGLEDAVLEAEIDRRTRIMFQRGKFDLYLFPDGREAVPDDALKPKLVIPRYTNVSASNPESPPDMVMDIFRTKGSVGGIRLYRNNMVFLVAHAGGVDAMYAAARRHLAMSKLAAPDSMSDYADYQKKEILDRKAASDDELDGAILKCYKYAYYPAKVKIKVKDNSLDYAVMDWKGRGDQQRLIGTLREKRKVRTDGDLPDLPESLVERISALEKGKMTTLDFRNEFYRDTALPMLIGDGVFKDGILMGIETGVFVYKSGDLLCGKGDPPCGISIDADSVVYTLKAAKRRGIWPRKIGGKKTPTGENGEPEKGPPVFDVMAVRVRGKPSQAVRNALDELRRNNVGRISKMQIESRGNVFPLLSVVGRMKGFDAELKIDGDYENVSGGSFNFEFVGTLKEAEPVQEFLKSQLQRTRVDNIRAALDIGFKDGIDVGWLETLADRLRLLDNDIEISGIEGASK